MRSDSYFGGNLQQQKVSIAILGSTCHLVS